MTEELAERPEEVGGRRELGAPVPTRLHAPLFVIVYHLNYVIRTINFQQALEARKGNPVDLYGRVELPETDRNEIIQKLGRGF